MLRSLIFGEQVWLYFLCNTCICEAEAECKGHARVSAVISPVLFPNPPTLGLTTPSNHPKQVDAHHSGLQRRVPVRTSRSAPQNRVCRVLHLTRTSETGPFLVRVCDYCAMDSANSAACAGPDEPCVNSGPSAESALTGVKRALAPAAPACSASEKEPLPPAAADLSLAQEKLSLPLALVHSSAIPSRSWNAQPPLGCPVAYPAQEQPAAFQSMPCMNRGAAEAGPSYWHSTNPSVYAQLPYCHHNAHPHTRTMYLSGVHAEPFTSAVPLPVHSTFHPHPHPVHSTFHPHPLHNPFELRECVDPASNRKYYWNTRTGEVSWDPPSSAFSQSTPSASDWAGGTGPVGRGPPASAFPQSLPYPAALPLPIVSPSHTPYAIGDLATSTESCVPSNVHGVMHRASLQSANIAPVPPATAASRHGRSMSMPDLREQLEAELRRKHQELAEIHVKMQLALGEPQGSPAPSGADSFRLHCQGAEHRDSDSDEELRELKVSLKLQALQIAGLIPSASPAPADEDEGDYVMVSQASSRDGSACDVPIAV